MNSKQGNAWTTRLLDEAGGIFACDRDERRRSRGHYRSQKKTVARNAPIGYISCVLRDEMSVFFQQEWIVPVTKPDAEKLKTKDVEGSSGGTLRKSAEKGDAMNWTIKQKKLFAAGFVLCVLFSGILWFWWPRSKEILPHKFLVESGMIRWCGQDKDCVRVRDGACGCRFGGVDEAINSFFKNEWFEYCSERDRRERAEQGEEGDMLFVCLPTSIVEPRCHFEEVFPACVERQCRLKNRRTGESW